MSTAPSFAALVLALFTLLPGCSGSEQDAPPPAHEAGAGAGGADTEAGGAPSDGPYASSVESFSPGGGAGFNRDKLPGLVLGPPQGAGTGQGSLDVLSLGSGGEIVLGFGARSIVDGPGADLLVFENPFWPDGNARDVFAELGEVSVSEDGETWHAFT